MADKNITCCFTGHRDIKLAWRGDENDPRCIALKQKIYDSVEAAYRSGIRHFICGMATGCDMYFCEAVMELRSYRDDVTIEAAIPFEGQSHAWPQSLRRRYDRLVSECDVCTVLEKDYTPDCMMDRNRYMVNHSSLLIAAYNGSKGGTLATILYAMRSGLEVIQIDF